MRGQRAVHTLRKDTSGEAKPAGTLILDFQPPELGENTFRLSKLPSLVIRRLAQPLWPLALLAQKFLLAGNIILSRGNFLLFTFSCFLSL